MPKFTEEKFLPYTPKQMFKLVADVALYPEFLPWCVGSRVYNQQANQFDADVIIGFKLFRERFTSRVTFIENQKVDVDYIRGPMKQLYNHWRFHPQDDGCLVEFSVEFEFKNKILDDLIGGLFGAACQRMVTAFEERAAALYGAAKTQ